jgi:hypothetical protein
MVFAALRDYQLNHQLISDDKSPHRIASFDLNERLRACWRCGGAQNNRCGGALQQYPLARSSSIPVPRSTWHRVHIHVPFPCAADLRGTGAGGRTREDHSGGHAPCLARSAAHTLRSSRASACGWGRAFQCADLRGTGVAQGQWPQREGQRCVAARAISRAMRGAHSAILAQRRRLVVSKGLARHLHWQTQRVVRGARAIRGVQQRDGSKVQFLRAIWRVARREWRCATDAPAHLTW